MSMFWTLENWPQLCWKAENCLVCVYAICKNILFLAYFLSRVLRSLSMLPLWYVQIAMLCYTECSIKRILFISQNFGIPGKAWNSCSNQGKVKRVKRFSHAYGSSSTRCKRAEVGFAESSCLVSGMEISLAKEAHKGGELISEGEDELYNLGVRTRDKFPQLFNEDYHPDVYAIKATQIPRASASAVVFGMGLLSGRGNLGTGCNQAFAVTSESRASDRLYLKNYLKNR
ncbi:hypothetical protein HYC85_030942 [Camellia sinensis]|uniref:Multiple inositol polyphosphate phosphatase 1 n=1 Tax=Camellia sinensis TaxID=4442 RepID=A0A7J7FPQ6_CAMSI|nr:hypothetical protein HYC85_030942 [Camellia sinensis]